MLRTLQIFGTSICLLLIPLQAAQLQAPERTENFPRGSLAHQPLPTYQAGYMFSSNQSHTAIWVDHADGSLGTALEKAPALPDSFRHDITGVAVSFDSTIAVSGSAMDKEGRFASFIAWFGMDGSLIRVVRISPFGAWDIGFTADGSLWVFGLEKANMRDEKPVHDVLRQYSADGKLVRSFLPRVAARDLSHPVYDGVLVTSRNYAAIVSTSAGKCALISTDGTIVYEGSPDYPEGFDTVTGAVTDSGRIFVEGKWRGNVENDYPKTPIFEIDMESKTLGLVDTSAAFGEDYGILMGAEGENLVFYMGLKSQLVWSGVN